VALRYVFVIAYGRAGSTLVQAMLNTVPGVCIRGENYGALYWLYRAVQSARWTRKVQGKRETGPDGPWFGAGEADPERLTRHLADGFVDAVLRPPEGTTVTGCKEIRFFELGRKLPAFIDFLREAFPGARFVFAIRRPEDVARSAWWAALPEKSARRTIERYNAMAAGLAEAPDSILMNGSSFPRDLNLCRELFAFLELPFDETAIAATLARRLDHARDARYKDLSRLWRP
jgi:hypothetical protein